MRLQSMFEMPTNALPKSVYIYAPYLYRPSNSPKGVYVHWLTVNHEKKRAWIEPFTPADMPESFDYERLGIYRESWTAEEWNNVVSGHVQYIKASFSRNFDGSEKTELIGGRAIAKIGLSGQLSSYIPEAACPEGIDPDEFLKHAREFMEQICSGVKEILCHNVGGYSWFEVVKE